MLVVLAGALAACSAGAQQPDPSRSSSVTPNGGGSAPPTGPAAGPATGSATGSASAAPPSSTGPSPTLAPSGPLAPVGTVVVTDDPAAASAADPGTAWPALLAQRLEGSGTPMAVATTAVAGSGFAPDGSAPSFADLVRDNVPGSTQLVILFDSRSGSAAGAAGRGADAALAAVERAAPDAVVVLVGPLPGAAPEPVRRAVADAATSAEALTTVVDPAAERWPTSPTQRDVADRLLPHLAPVAAPLARSGAAL